MSRLRPAPSISSKSVSRPIEGANLPAEVLIRAIACVSFTGTPVLRSVERVPEDPAQRRGFQEFSEQDRVRGAVGDLVVADLAVQVEDAVVVRVDRRVDVVVAARRS